MEFKRVLFRSRVVTRCQKGETVEKKMFASQIAYVIDWVFERTLGYGQAKVQVAFLHPLKRIDGQIDDLEANAGRMADQMPDERHATEFPHVRRHRDAKRAVGLGRQAEHTDEHKTLLRLP